MAGRGGQQQDEITEFTMQQDMSQRIAYDVTSNIGSEKSNFMIHDSKVSIEYHNPDDTDEDTVFGNQSEVRRQGDVKLMGKSTKVQIDREDDSV